MEDDTLWGMHFNDRVQAELNGTHRTGRDRTRTMIEVAEMSMMEGRSKDGKIIKTALLLPFQVSAFLQLTRAKHRIANKHNHVF